MEIKTEGIELPNGDFHMFILHFRQKQNVVESQQRREQMKQLK